MDFEQYAEQADRFTDEALRLDDEHARDVAIKLKDAVEGIHREALVRIVRRMKEDPATLAVLKELAQDPAVRMVLLLHDIIRPPTSVRVEEALEDVRPYIRSHGGEVELLGVADGTVRLRLLGACQGCAGSQATLRNGVEKAIRERAPEIHTIELADDTPTAGPALIAPDAIGVSTKRDPADGWRLAVARSQVRPGHLTRVEVDGVDLLLAEVDDQVVCYRNVCAHMAMPLHGGDLDGGVLTCPWHGFAYLLESGECLTAPEVQLDPCPVRVRAGQIEVRPAMVAT